MTTPTPCFGKSALFDSVDIHDHRAAKALCATCPAIDDCRGWLKQTRAASKTGCAVGTWAGTLQGRATRHACESPSPSSYKRHRARGEEACEPCKEAHAERARARYWERKEAESDDTDLHRCEFCGDWTWRTKPCAVCAVLESARAGVASQLHISAGRTSVQFVDGERTPVHVECAA